MTSLSSITLITFIFQEHFGQVRGSTSTVEKEILPHLDKYNNSYNPGQMVISHPHQDHSQEAEKINESDNFNIGLVTLPHNKDVARKAGRP